MGIYLNPGNENFKRTLSAPIYVDKTDMLRALNTFIDQGNNYVCVSRPRRFGKTIAGNMISAYYSKGCDSKRLFANLKIALDTRFEERLNRYDVIKIDLNGEYQTAENKKDTIKRLQHKVKKEFYKEFPNIAFEDDLNLAEMIMTVYQETNETFIIIIDEYDILVREQVEKELFTEYIAFLNGLFKNDTLRPAISLAYITGILPVVRDKIQSKLNNFEEYTILEAGELAEYVGFTSLEVETLCERYGVDFNECRLWYDGYRQHGYEIYNPESVVKCIRNKAFSGYWGKTSSYKVISDLIIRDFDGIREDVISMLAGENVPVNVSSYMNTMTDFSSKSDVFTYLVYVGYLAFDMDTYTCRIPNKEIRQEWFNVMETEAKYKETDRIIKASRQLLEDTINGDEDAVARALDISHIHVTSNRSYNNEDALASAIYLAYIYALNEYNVYKELTTGKGFADVVFVPFREERPAMIIELKHNKSADSALDQIRQKQYFKSLEHYNGNLLFVGISYDEKTKKHSCRIERFVKDVS